jgi:O-antigen/teichoic acid export membrane protein
MSPILIPLISAKPFHASYKLVPLISLGSIFYSMACLADAGILISKKTGYKPLIFGLSAFIAVALNLLLVPRYSSLGAAIAIAFSFLTLFIINLYISNKFYVIVIEYKKLFSIFMFATTAYLFSIFLFSFADNIKYMKIFSILPCLIYPAMLWFGGFFSADEKLFVRGLFARLRLRTTEATSKV